MKKATPTNSIKTKPTKIKILVANNFPLVRQALRIFIEKQKDMEIIAEASDGQEVLDLLNRVIPDLIVLDAYMPKITVHDLVRQITDINKNIKILILIDDADGEQIVNLLKTGISGYIPKNVTAEDIIHALRAIIGGEKYIHFNPNLNTTQDAIHDERHFLDNLSKLNPREFKIIKLIANGLSNKDIATELGLNERSLKYSITTIFSKLGVSSRTEAVHLAVKTRLLSINDFNQ